MDKLKATLEEVLWRPDLQEFLAELDEFEDGEKGDGEEGIGGSGEARSMVNVSGRAWLGRRMLQTAPEGSILVKIYQ